jgi:hypothetical protein
MPRLILAALALFVLSGAAAAAEGWGRYVNEWYGYRIDIPPGFSRVAEADNGDGGWSRSADGQAALAVWGRTIAIAPFASEALDDIHSAEQDGWTVSYRKVTDRWASWSGERGGRILYARAVVLCGDESSGHFRLEYPAAQRQAYDAIVTRLVKSLQHTECR